MTPPTLPTNTSPPEQAGGTVITQTCRDCNSTLGTLVDVDLVDLLSDTATSWWSSKEAGVQGRRNFGRTLLRSTPDGKFAWVMSGGDQLRRNLAQMMSAGEVTAEIRLPGLRRARISGLKNAYLAACAQLHQIPDTPSAREVRGELLAVRQLGRRRNGLPPASPIAHSITMGLIAENTLALGINLCRLASPAGKEEPGILFANRFALAWPIPDTAPRLTGRLPRSTCT